MSDEAASAPSPFFAALRELSNRRVILIGGKGGVGKTTIANAAAEHLRGSILLHVDALDAEAMYKRFLGDHLDSFLEIGDRGTYLDREELRRLFELSLPGIDELMTWMHIGELAEEHAGSTIVVDTAPTGHTLRMLSSSDHFRQLALALDAMQEKHRAMVRQFTRRDVRDVLDQFIDDFDARAKRRHEMLLDPARTAFLPVMLSEPLVVEQTLRLIAEVGIDVPFVVLNRAVHDPDCALDEVRMQRDAAARAQFARVVDYPRSCGAAAGMTDPSSAFGTFSPRGGEKGLDAHSSRVPRIVTPALNADVSLVRDPSPPLAGEKVPKADEGETAAPHIRRMTFFAGKGGVGKTTCATSVALQLANEHPEKQYAIISVDPAHSLRDIFATQQPPANLTVECIDTKAKWGRFRDSIGREIENAFDALTPRGLSVAHDSEAMQRLVEIAPPGADELFAIIRLADLAADESVAGVIVDTAPTGHFLRLLDLPKAAGEWVREFMRLLLRYKELIPAGSLGEELVRASRALKDLDATLRSDRTSVIVVTRPQREVIDETKRLSENVRSRGIEIGGIIANYVTPDNECKCDQSLRAEELGLLADLHASLIIERREVAPVTLEELAGLFPS